MDRLDTSNAEDAERIRAMILSDNLSDYGSVDDKMNPKRIMRNQEKIIRRVQKTQSQKMIAAMKWTLLTIVSLEKTRPSVVR
jgi:hypothetical protein